MNITEELFKLKDEKYADFQSNLTPNMKRESIIGVRVPKVRELAKRIKNEPETKKFMKKLPHKYYDENMLHSAIICEIKDYYEVIEEVNLFLPYVDNWAVCDTMSPKIFKKHKDELIIEIKKWIKSKETYICRFGIEMLMSFYLDEDFKPEYSKMISKIRSKEYYLNMMIAWYFATALAKQWDETISIIENNELDKWVHNKTIQKACESYRITDEQKEYLRKLKQ